MKQSVVDRYVDDLACTIGVSRSQLNVVGCRGLVYAILLLTLQTAAAKGLVAGSFTISRGDGTRVDGSSDGEVLLKSAISWLKLTTPRVCLSQKSERMIR